MTVHPTRFEVLGFAKIKPGLWRVVALDYPRRPAAVGPHYRTRGELLADLDRYAFEAWGLA